MPHWRTPWRETEAQTVQPWLEPAPDPGCSRVRGGGRGDRRLREVLAVTPTQAQRTQDAARARGAWLTWFVAERAGRGVAWAVVADQHGGTRVPGELQANTLYQLRAMLPAGLTHHHPAGRTSWPT